MNRTAGIAAAAASFVAAAWFFIFSGIGWGVPSSERVRLSAGKLLVNEAVFASMAEARDYVYKDNKNPIAASPFLRNDELRALPRIDVDYPRRGPDLRFYNYLRHYYLGSEDTDEGVIFNSLSHIKPAKLQFDPHYGGYGGGYIYPLGVWLMALHAAGALELVPDMKHYFRSPDLLGRVYKAVRSFGAVVGAAGILLTALLLLRTSGSVFWPAFLALLCLSAPVTVVIAKATKPHFPVIIASAGVLFFTARLCSSGEKRWFWYAMAACGVAAGMITNAAALALLPCLAYFFYPLQGRTPRGSLKDLAAGAALLAGVAVLLNPYWVLSADSSLADFRYMRALTRTEPSLLSVWYMFRYALGLPFSALFAAAVLAAALEKTRLDPLRRSLLVFLLVMTVVISGVPPYPGSSRYATFMLPLFAYFIADTLRRIPKGNWTALAASAVLALAFADTARFRSYYVNDVNPAANTRMRAAAWLDRELRGEWLGTFFDLTPWLFPPVDLTARRISVYQDLDQLLADPGAPRWLVSTEYQFNNCRPESLAAFAAAYEPHAEFANPVEVLPGSWNLISANMTIHVYRRRGGR